MQIALAANPGHIFEAEIILDVSSSEAEHVSKAEYIEFAGCTFRRDETNPLRYLALHTYKLAGWGRG